MASSNPRTLRLLREIKRREKAKASDKTIYTTHLPRTNSRWKTIRSHPSSTDAETEKPQTPQEEKACRSPSKSASGRKGGPAHSEGQAEAELPEPALQLTGHHIASSTPSYDLEKVVDEVASWKIFQKPAESSGIAPRQVVETVMEETAPKPRRITIPPRSRAMIDSPMSMDDASPTSASVYGYNTPIGESDPTALLKQHQPMPVSDTVKENHQQYQPSSHEIIEYAKALGMDVREDRDLLWIAKAALQDPLPAPWQVCYKYGTVYFVNFESGACQFDDPGDAHYQALYRAEKKKRISPLLKPVTNTSRRRPLSTWCLDDNGLDDLALECVVANMSSSVTELSLSNNYFTDRGMEPLAQLLERQTSIQHLTLSCNSQIGEDGVDLIGQMLSQNKTLEHLDLAHCRINDYGATCLSTGLEHNHTLTSLVLHHNEIGDVGARALRSCLGTCALEALDLSSNPISEEVMAELDFTSALEEALTRDVRPAPSRVKARTRRQLVLSTQRQAGGEGSAKKRASANMDIIVSSASTDKLAHPALHPTGEATKSTDKPDGGTANTAKTESPSSNVRTLSPRKLLPLAQHDNFWYGLKKNEAAENKAEGPKLNKAQQLAHMLNVKRVKENRLKAKVRKIIAMKGNSIPVSPPDSPSESKRAHQRRVSRHQYPDKISLFASQVSPPSDAHKRSQTEVNLIPYPNSPNTPSPTQANDQPATKPRSSVRRLSLSSAAPARHHRSMSSSHTRTRSRSRSRSRSRRHGRTKSRGDPSRVQWTRGELLGRGATGKVYMAMNIRSGQYLAVKQIHIGSNTNLLEELENEIAVMKELDHPNIVKLLDAQRRGRRLNILMEYVAGNSMAVLLDQFGPLPEYVARNYVRQLLEALRYCHAQNVVHRDLKAKNILVDTKGEVKLADFGSATKNSSDGSVAGSPLSGFHGTALWTAPEVLGNDGEYDSKVDIWSLGCVVIEMASAQPPWSEMNFPNPFCALFHIQNADNTPRIPDSYSEAGQAFIARCLIRDRTERPSAEELLKDPWLYMTEADDTDDSVSVTSEYTSDYSPLSSPTHSPHHSLDLSHGSNSEVIDDILNTEFLRPPSRPHHTRRADESHVPKAAHGKPVLSRPIDNSSASSDEGSSENVSAASVEEPAPDPDAESEHVGSLQDIPQRKPRLGAARKTQSLLDLLAWEQESGIDHASTEEST